MSHKHWGEFWEQGYITTFGPSLRSNYTGQLERFWKEIFDSLEENAKILDLATGNGALACLAYEVTAKTGKSLNIYAIDAARIPSNINASDNIKTAREKIRFFGEMPCESLKFEDNQFDLITSQFGIEYANWDKSLAEVFRTLITGSSAHFICHSRESSLIKNSLQEISVYRSAMDEINIFEIAYNFAKRYGSSHDINSAEKEKLNLSVNNFQKQFSNQELGRILLADLISSLKLLNKKPAELVADKIRSLKSTYQAAYSRQQDMLQAALSENDIKNILELASRLGFSEASSNKFFQRNEFVGVYIKLTK